MGRPLTSGTRSLRNHPQTLKKTASSDKGIFDRWEEEFRIVDHASKLEPSMWEVKLAQMSEESWMWGEPAMRREAWATHSVSSRLLN